MSAPRVTLLCLPCAGASAVMYLRWRRLLPAWVRLLPVELPGRGTRLGEPLQTAFEPLVAQLCDELCAHEPATLSGRFALFGHSMGGLLAWGLAQRLRMLQRPLPALLFVAACPAPTQRDPRRYADHDTDARLIADLRAQGGTPDELFDSPELLHLTLQTLRADYRVCASVPDGPHAPLPCPIHAYGGRQDAIAASRIAAWRREARSLFSLTWLDGGHFFIRQSEAALLAALRGELEALRLEEPAWTT